MRAPKANALYYGFLLGAGVLNFKCYLCLHVTTSSGISIYSKIFDLLARMARRSAACMCEK